MAVGITPQQAWDQLVQGNARFVSGDALHPNQDLQRRHLLESGQRPTAVLFGCGDSRVASEIIFDQGLGDIFVVRTAGHIVDDAVLGSIEFGVAVLDVPLIVILGHQSCGAVAAAIDAAESGKMPPGYVRDIVVEVLPSVAAAQAAGACTPAEVGSRHVRATADLLLERSRIVHDAVERGELGIVGATYTLSDGLASVITSTFTTGTDPAE
ncbi:carbonic anhydrase [Flexivirga caeni]|uniref:carbonic anhydrase n=1 Tax=Flexivirga caeni TaxID=2294115 RepID=A0A3M9M7I6_9MICO|nr:carbonic anhydrase [Flexivirga caeni]RNI21530.1 carbonic anhydrase [Flexivirga caeni]